MMRAKLQQDEAQKQVESKIELIRKMKKKFEMQRALEETEAMARVQQER